MKTAEEWAAGIKQGPKILRVGGIWCDHTALRDAILAAQREALEEAKKAVAETEESWGASIYSDRWEGDGEVPAPSDTIRALIDKL